MFIRQVNILVIQMGNAEYRGQELAQYAPQMHNYTLAHCYSPLSIYRHLYNSEEIMEFRETLHSTQDIDRKLQTFIARYQHTYLVASLFMRLEASTNCANSEFEMRIYYERVVTNLSKINEISFRDALHCLAVALKGFEILFKNFGYFEVFENMFHICQRGRLKVWCNQNIYKNVPEQYLLGEGREEDMVVRVIGIIDQNMDPACRIFPVKEALITQKKVTFSNAIIALRQICRENNFSISENLQSLENFSQFQSVLDIYTPPKRFPKDTLVTFYPKNARTTPPRSSSSSSHKTANKIAGSRGKSQESKEQNKFEVTVAQEDQFPKFVAGRKKNYSNSSLRDSTPRLTPHPHPHPHPHLQQFSKITKDESHLRRRNIMFNDPQTRPPSQLLQQRPASPHLIQRQASTPVLLMNPNYPQRHAEYPIIHQYPTQMHTPQRYPLQVARNQVHRPAPVRIEASQHRPQLVFNLSPVAQNPRLIEQSKVERVERRGASVPIKMSYQGINPRQITFSPNKQVQKKKPSVHTSANKNAQSNQKERLITLGETSSKKPVQFINVTNPPQNQKKQQKISFPQLQSKIELLQSFAENKITTQQFLPNQSHALSNIKWQKNSNSGRDSVTSTFRKDILLELSNKPSEKKQQWKREQSLLRKQSSKPSKFEQAGFYTNQGLLQLIKSGVNTDPSSRPYPYDKASFDEKMKKYQQKYSKQDIIKQLSTKSHQSSKDYNQYSYKYTDNYLNSYNIFSEQSNKASTPTFGTFQKASFKKKPQPYHNKISAISEKWQEQNICSTSNGSRNMNIQSSNIDEDILEDMHNEGFGMGFAKRFK